MNYDMIDRFLRNNLGDDDYAEYSAALDALCTPQRTWVNATTWRGLTDEEISKIPAWIYSPDQDGMTAEEGLEVFARAIEAKLKAKNSL